MPNANVWQSACSVRFCTVPRRNGWRALTSTHRRGPPAGRQVDDVGDDLHPRRRGGIVGREREAHRGVALVGELEVVLGRPPPADATGLLGPRLQAGDAGELEAALGDRRRGRVDLATSPAPRTGACRSGVDAPPGGRNTTSSSASRPGSTETWLGTTCGELRPATPTTSTRYDSTRRPWLRIRTGIRCSWPGPTDTTSVPRITTGSTPLPHCSVDRSLARARSATTDRSRDDYVRD